MCDLNWCPVCEKAISCESDSLYCSLGCLQHDANNHINHDFHNFLAPKPCSSATFKSRRFSLHMNDRVPDLSSSSSIYTSSTISMASSSSIFTRRADLVSRGLLQQTNKDKDDEDEFTSCCDFCENLKTSPQVPQRVSFLAGPINLTAN